MTRKDYIKIAEVLKVEIEIMDDVIACLFDDYTQEQEYAQTVISAWIRIKDKLKEQD